MKYSVVVGDVALRYLTLYPNRGFSTVWALTVIKFSWVGDSVKSSVRVWPWVRRVIFDAFSSLCKKGRDLMSFFLKTGLVRENLSGSRHSPASISNIFSPGSNFCVKGRYFGSAPLTFKDSRLDELQPSKSERASPSLPLLNLLSCCLAGRTGVAASGETVLCIGSRTRLRDPLRTKIWSKSVIAPVYASTSSP